MLAGKEVKHTQHTLQEKRSVSLSSLIAAIVATLLIRIASRTSFVILGFYLGAQIASATAVVLVLQIFYVSELLVAPTIGSMSDRMGRKPFLLLAPVLACVAACCLLLAARLFPHPSVSIWNLRLIALLLFVLLGRLLEGAASGMNVPATLGYLTDASVGSDRLRARVITAFEIVTVGGLTLGIPFGGKISSSLDTWGFLVVAAIYAVVLLLIAFCLEECMEQHEEKRGGKPQNSLIAGLSVIRYRRVYTFLPAWFCVNGLVGAWTSLVTIMLAYPLPAADARHPGQLLYGGFSKMGASLWVGLFALMFLVGMGVWMFVLPRVRRTTVMLIGLGGLALAIAALTVINRLGENPHTLSHSAIHLVAILLPLALIGVMLLSGFTPASLIQMGAIAETLSRRHGAVMGLYSVVLAIGQLLGSAMGGFFVDLAGFYGLMLFSVIMGLLALVCVLYMRSHKDDLIGASNQPSLKLV